MVEQNIKDPFDFVERMSSPVIVSVKYRSRIMMSTGKTFSVGRRARLPSRIARVSSSSSQNRTTASIDRKKHQAIQYCNPAYDCGNKTDQYTVTSYQLQYLKRRWSKQHNFPFSGRAIAYMLGIYCCWDCSSPKVRCVSAVVVWSVSQR
jgi:hypothetical protein